MNPVPYIFRAKNYYGMKDQADLIITPNNPTAEPAPPEEIADYLLAISEDAEN